MGSVPEKFYELCRLCLSRDGAKLSIFDEEGARRHLEKKIASCLPILVSVFQIDDREIVRKLIYRSISVVLRLFYQRHGLFSEIVR